MDGDEQNQIQIVGAKTHNLKNITVSLPRHQVVVITGPSGSGKSSLAIDTLAAEGQRQYFESLSLHSRQFFKQLPAADVDRIERLPPTIFIEQSPGQRNRRSTVGTLTEIHDYLRLLMSRCGQLVCPNCQQVVSQHTRQQIQEWVGRLPEKTKIMILAPIADAAVGDHQAVLDAIRRDRLVRVRIDGEILDIDQVHTLDPRKPHSIAAVTDRLFVRPDIANRLDEAITLADRLAEGQVIVCYMPEQQDRAASSSSWVDQLFSTRLACARCRLAFEELEPHHFSFNSPHGACPHCDGLGFVERTAELSNGKENEELGDTSIPFDSELKAITATELCSACQGSRLGTIARSVIFQGQSIVQILQMSLTSAINFFRCAEIEKDRMKVAGPLIEEISRRLSFLMEVGVGYLNLGRAVNSLSGGEHQRVRLASSIGTGLTNVAYILDEPSIGLHPRDTGRLIDSIRNLQSIGNTVVLVEHDEAIIRSADFLIEVGPGAGEHGGEIIASGTPQRIISDSHCLTGKYLAGEKKVFHLAQRRKWKNSRQLELRGASGRNLKTIDVEIPLGLLVAVTGVSGSGKSSLINGTLVPAIQHDLRLRAGFKNSHNRSLAYSSLTGTEMIDSLVVVDQKLLTLSPRACPATALDIFDDIRKIFAATKKAKQLGFGVSRFSFNSKTGWCPDCRGQGTKRVEMNYLPDFFVTCETCGGRRFNLQTLQVKFNEKSIADILQLTCEAATDFFEGFEVIAGPLNRLKEVGLGYLKLGQSMVTLSGGESQRLKLAAELAAPTRGHTLYVFDEPTTGLHFDDIRHLLLTMNRLVDRGHSMLVIEHNLDVIASADWVIDIGPDGGEQGGEILAAGPPEFIARTPQSVTGQFLASTLAN